MKEPKEMREIHRIRVKLWNEWRNMSEGEILKSIKEKSALGRKRMKELSRKATA